MGGLIGGAKIGRCRAALPLCVQVSQVPAPPGFFNTLSQHFVGIFTGRPRLARNLLQDVIRRWYSGLPEILTTTAALVANAERAARAIKEGDIVQLGACYSTYWRQKQRMAAGCEPPAVTEMMRVLGPHSHGMCMGGAGGGGFMFVIAKEPWGGASGEGLATVRALLEAECSPAVINIAADVSFHQIHIDTEGTVVSRTRTQR